MPPDSVIPSERGRLGQNGGAESESVVQVRDVTKFVGPLKVRDGVSVDVRQGQMVAIVGRRGSGKSTLLRCMNALETIQGGEIVICGHDVGGGKSNKALLRRDVGMVFQSYNLFPHLTAERRSENHTSELQSPDHLPTL